MKGFPSTDLLRGDVDISGHYWVQELVTGRRLRFQVRESGFLAFGDVERQFEAGEVPLPYRHASRHVQRSLDLESLQASVDSTESVTFFGVATLYRGVDYGWIGVPAFLGVDVWVDERDSYLPPDAAYSAYSSLGLTALPAIDKEVTSKYTDFTEYVEGETPGSRYRDGGVAGVLVRDKSGGRGQEWLVELDGPGSVGSEGVEEIVDRYVTTERIESAIMELRSRSGGASVENVLERVLMGVVREEYSNLHRDGDFVHSERRFRSAVAEKVQRHLE